MNATAVSHRAAAEPSRSATFVLPMLAVAAITSLCLLAAPLSAASLDKSDSEESAQAVTSTIGGGFNGTAIAKGRTLWFSSVFKYAGPTSGDVSIFLTNVHIQFTAGGVHYNVPVPDAQIQLSSTTTTTTTSYDSGSNSWITHARFGLSGNLWLDGVGFPVPVDFPGGIRPVTWSADFATNTPGATINWQWACAVYKSFNTDLNALNVKPCDDNHGSAIHNSDHAGTPEAYRSAVTGGATGGGGSNFTGSLSPTGHVSFGPCVGPLPSSTISGPDSLCTSQTAQLCGPEAPAGTVFIYAWNTGASSRCITISHAGTYSLTVTNACGSSSSTHVVRPGVGVACNITGPSTICAGTPTEICGPVGDGLHYLWSTGDTTRCISVTAQATYTLTVTGGCGGPTTCSKQLRASSPPVCTITGPDSICSRQTAQLCGPEAFQGTQFHYLWSTGDSSRCITISQPGTYTLTVSTPDCGSATCSKTVTIGTAIACTIQGPGDIDPDSTAELCGPKGSGLHYQWSTGDTTRCITIHQAGTYDLTVTSASCGSSSCSWTVLNRPTSSCRCSFFYPDSSNLPRSMQPYTESGLVAAVVPGKSGCPIGDDSQLKLWYNDESAFALGIRRVVVYTSPTDSVVTNYPYSASPAVPACMTGPQLGDTLQSGLHTGNDTAVDGGRPIWPVLYITDITLDKNSRAGDWEQGSVSGIPASRVCGVWTTGVRRVFTYLGNKVTIAMDPSPAANHWNLGAGADVPPGGFGAYPDLGYGAEVSWDLTTLGFLPGHRYRLYTILHDGDQQAANGGDAGHACTRVVVSQLGAITLDPSDGSGPGTPGGIGIRQIDANALSGVAPLHYALSQNVPNPFRGGEPTVIRFAVPEKSTVELHVFTVTGQRIATLASGSFEPGERSIVWHGTTDDGRSLPPGMYLAKMEAVSLSTGRFIQMRKMVMVK